MPKQLSGSWTLIWYLDEGESHSEKFVFENKYSIEMYHLLRYVAFSYLDENNSYKFFGMIEDGNILSGKWYYEHKGGYFGFFQGYIDREFVKISGKWMGFNSKNEIIANRLTLNKL